MAPPTSYCDVGLLGFKIIFSSGDLLTNSTLPNKLEIQTNLLRTCMYKQTKNLTY